MLYFNQSFNYLTRKNRSIPIDTTRFYPHDIYDFRERNMHICKDEYYILVKDLIKQYGKSWLKLGLPIVKTKEGRAVNNKYIHAIEHFILQSRLNQFSIISKIKEIYNGPINENDREVIKPYELDIYLPELKLAIEYNSIKYHSIKAVDNTYYHLKKSTKCRRKGIRLIHIYGFEDFNTQIKLLQDLLNGIDNYPKNDFNKNNLVGNIPKPALIYQDKKFAIYGAGKLV